MLPDSVGRVDGEVFILEFMTLHDEVGIVPRGSGLDVLRCQNEPSAEYVRRFFNFLFIKDAEGILTHQTAEFFGLWTVESMVITVFDSGLQSGRNENPRDTARVKSFETHEESRNFSIGLIRRIG